MKRVLGVSLLIVCLLHIAGCSVEKPTQNIAYTELGVPSSSRYPDGTRARCPWDMIVWEGSLYIGGGDYDTNAGPVDIWAYNLETNTWHNSGTVPDEEVFRFCIIEDGLIAPGIDPTEDWTYGNYYELVNGEWTKHRTIPSGVHNFDMVEFDGWLFCGLGVPTGEYPIARSGDNGKTFSAVEMYKNGVPIDTSGSEFVRVYDLFVFEDALYAVFYYGDSELVYDLYRYEDGVFVFDNQWYQKIHQVKFSNHIIGGKVEYKGHMFFTAGYLYATDDMANFTRVVFPNDPVVYDIGVYNDSLYVLCGEKKEDGTYTISVWKNRNQKVTSFSELFNFSYEIPPLSLTWHDSTFYIGMGDASEVQEKNGMVLQIDYDG